MRILVRDICRPVLFQQRLLSTPDGVSINYTWWVTQNLSRKRFRKTKYQVIWFQLIVLLTNKPAKGFLDFKFQFSFNMGGFFRASLYGRRQRGDWRWTQFVKSTAFRSEKCYAALKRTKIWNKVIGVKIQKIGKRKICKAPIENWHKRSQVMLPQKINIFSYSFSYFLLTAFDGKIRTSK